MRVKGYGGRWKKWIWDAWTLNFSIMMNGKPRGRFSASRGLRQGDPLSPCLFTLVVDGLSRLVRKTDSCNLVEGFTVGRDRI